jgi:4'-phosphopantetheinyl transferase
MPFLLSIQINQNTTAYLWQITEDIATLYEQVLLNENSKNRLQTMQSISHQKGFLAVRMLLQHVGLSDFDLFYDQSGKPHLKYEVRNTKLEELKKNNTTTSFTPLGANEYISISHSHEFSSICISNQPIGIDLEILKPKTLTIAPRFMNVNHLENLTETEKLEKATVVWGVKESVFKLKNQKGISFPNHISETSFKLEDKTGKAQLNFNNQTENFIFYFKKIENYIFVCTFYDKF